MFLVFKNRLMLNNCINFRESLKFQKVTKQKTKQTNAKSVSSSILSFGRSGFAFNLKYFDKLKSMQLA